MVAASHTAVSGSAVVNELRFQFAQRDQKIDSLDPRAAARAIGEDRGRPDARVLGRRERRPPAVHAAAAVERPLSGARYAQLLRAATTSSRPASTSTTSTTRSALPLHFGGRYIFARAAGDSRRCCRCRSTRIQAVALGLPAATCRAMATRAQLVRLQRHLAVRAGRLAPDVDLTLKLGPALSESVLAGRRATRVRVSGPYTFPTDGNNFAPRLSVAWDPTGDQKTSVHGAYGIFYDNHITAHRRHHATASTATDRVRTLVAALPDRRVAAWNAPGPPAAGAAPARIPSLVISIDPGLETPYAHHASVGIDRELPGVRCRCRRTSCYVRGFNQLGTIDYNPIVPSLGAGRRPEDVDGRRRHVRVGPAVHVVRRDLVSRPHALADQALQRTATSSSRATRCRRPRTTRPTSRARSSRRTTAAAATRHDRDRVAARLRSDAERGPSLQDQRHRFVLSGLYVAPGACSCRRSSPSARAVRTTSWPAPISTATATAARSRPIARGRTPAIRASSVGRNAGTMPTQATVDLRREPPLHARRPARARRDLRGVQSLQPDELHRRSTTSSAPARIRRSPLPTFGQFTQAAAPRQVQLAAKIHF